MGREGVQKFGVIDGTPVGPGGRGPLPERQVGIGDDQIRREFRGGSQPVAGGTGPPGRVKGKTGGRELGIADAAGRADRGFGKAKRLGVGAVDLHPDPPVGLGEGQLQRVRQPVPDGVLDHQPVHHHVDVVGPGPGQFFDRLDLPDLAIHLDPGESLLSQSLEQLFVGSLFPLHQGRQEDDPGPLPQGHDGVHHGVQGLGGDGTTADVAVGDAHPGVEKTQVVVDFGHRAHC